MDQHNRQDEFLDQTLRFWQPRTDRALTIDDARDIVNNVAGFFTLLLKWDAKERVQVHSDDDDIDCPMCELEVV